MVGKYQLEIGWQDAIKGVSTSNSIPDGGFSPNNSYGINLAKSPGAFAAMATPTDASTNAADEFISSCNDVAASSLLRIFVGDAANYYTLSGTTLTKRVTGTATTKYRAGVTNIVPFGGFFFCTLTDNIARLAGNYVTLVEDWWTNAAYGNQSALSTGNGEAHPMLTYERQLFIADRYYLHKVTEALAISTQALTFATNEIIMALGIDPSTGLMMISTSVGSNASGSVPSATYVYLWDGASAKPRAKFQTSGLVTAFYPAGGIMFVGYAGNTIGVWNGRGVSFLRTLTSVSTANYVDSPYPHKFASIGTTLYFVDGTKIFAYGEVQAGGQKVFYPVFIQSISGVNNISCISPVNGSDSFPSIGISWTGASSARKFYVLSPSSTSSGSGSMQFNRIDFPRPVFIRGARLFTGGIANGHTMGTLEVFSETGVGVTPFINATISNATDSTKWVYDLPAGSPKVNSIQPRFSWANTSANNLLNRIVVYYDIAE